MHMVAYVFVLCYQNKYINRRAAHTVTFTIFNNCNHISRCCYFIIVGFITVFLYRLFKYFLPSFDLFFELILNFFN
jgi:hypothetical protein